MESGDAVPKRDERDERWLRRYWIGFRMKVWLWLPQLGMICGRVGDLVWISVAGESIGPFMSNRLWANLPDN